MGVRGVRVQSTDGIVEHNVEYTLDNFCHPEHPRHQRQRDP